MKATVQLTAKRLGIFSLLLGALSLSAFAQSDIQVPGSGPYKTLARQWTWAGGGPGAINNNFIFSPVPNFGNACFMVQNNDTNTHTFGISAAGSTDPNALQFLNNTTVWRAIPIIGSNQFSLTSGNNAFFSIYTGGYSKIAVTFSGGSGAGTVTVTSTESPTSNLCNNYSGDGFHPFTGQAGLFQCDSTAQAQIAAASTTSVIAPQANSRVFICGFSISTDAALTGNGFTIVTGTGATCGTGTTTLWGPVSLGTTVGSFYNWGGGLGIALPIATANNRVCVTSAATVGTVRINIWFTQVIGL